ncbi:hypothetical protein KSS87_009815 [Heliosperma pusillum]|nr:hypothetical protein KSS87_009815 [Heliosperma pusillum]
MESNYAKVLDSRCRVFADLKRNKVAPYLSGASPVNVLRYSALKSSSSSKLGKRKKPDACKSKCRSYRQPRYYENFMKSGLPKRLMFYQNGGWVDHGSEIIAMVREEFRLKKAAVEVKLSGHHLVFDFVRMVQFNFRTALELSLAWIDEDGCCFFPEVYNDVDEQNACLHVDKQKEELSLSAQHGGQEIKLQINIEVNGVSDPKLLEYSGETSPIVKRIKVGHDAEVEDSCDKVSDVRVIENIRESQHLEKIADTDVEIPHSNLNAETVREMFLEGMNMADCVDVVGVGSNTGSMWQGRLELFLKQVEITRKFRGDANIRYAWFGSTKEASAGIMAYGLGHFGLQQIKSTYGLGLHLAAASCVNTSLVERIRYPAYCTDCANNCDVDENGVRYMVFCRVIMGNMEMVHAGSKQFHPSNEDFDSGVDDLKNPQQYVVWSMNINTHIYPEYVVSFRVPTNCEGSVPKNNHKHEILRLNPVNGSSFDPCKVGAAIDIKKIVSVLKCFGLKGLDQEFNVIFYLQKIMGICTWNISLKHSRKLSTVASDHQSNVTRDGSKERTASLNSTTARVPKSPWMPFPVLLAVSFLYALANVPVYVALVFCTTEQVNQPGELCEELESNCGRYYFEDYYNAA